MRLHIDPPLDRWQLGRRPSIDRDALVELSRDHARRLSTEPLSGKRRIIGTGHQPLLWHPGILAKDIVACAMAGHLRAQALHVVVDHDTLDWLDLEVPVAAGQRLQVVRIVLAALKPNVPACCQPPVPVRTIEIAIDAAATRWGDRLLVNLDPIRSAFDRPGIWSNAAEQITAALCRLRQQVTAPLPVVFASQLVQTERFGQLVDQMRAQAVHCVRCYNDAAEAHRAAGIAPLQVLPDQVELPLWAVGWRKPRHRVYAQVAGGATSLRLKDGRSVGAAGLTLAPRALLLTGLLRSGYCDLFIHGRGGALYDRVTEAWWGNWLQSELAPRATVSADLPMAFDLPVATAGQLAQASWWAHHLRHNLDRALDLDGPGVQRKRILLSHMDDDRDRARRARAFARIHQVNDELARHHPEPLADAAARLRDARTGVANLAAARKRDWCFALYRPTQLRALVKALDPSP